MIMVSQYLSHVVSLLALILDWLRVGHTLWSKTVLPHPMWLEEAKMLKFSRKALIKKKLKILPPFKKEYYMNAITVSD